MPDAYGQETEAERTKRELRSQAGHAQAPTDFTNFGRRFSANKGAAQSSANKYAQQAASAVDAAGNALKGAQSAFAAGVNTGTVQGPGGAPSTNTGAAAVPPSNAAPVPPPVVPQHTPDEDAQLARAGLNNVNTEGPSLAEMLAKAGQEYTGPEGINDQAATDAALKAQTQATQTTRCRCGSPAATSTSSTLCSAGRSTSS